MSNSKPVFVGKREETAHANESCASGSSQIIREMSPEEAREKGYTPCLDCLQEGWPDE